MRSCNGWRFLCKRRHVHSGDKDVTLGGRMVGAERAEGTQRPPGPRVTGIAFWQRISGFAVGGNSPAGDNFHA